MLPRDHALHLGRGSQTTLLWPECWAPVCTWLLSGRPPSLLPPLSLESQVCHAWSVPDEVAFWAGGAGEPCLAPAVSRMIALGWPLQLLSSYLSPAAGPHLPGKRQTRSPPRPRAWPLVLVTLPRSAFVRSEVLSSAEAWPFCLGSPGSGSGSPALPADHDEDAGGTWPFRGRSVQWACHTLRPRSHQERHPCQGPLQDLLPAQRVLCSASPWLEWA